MFDGRIVDLIECHDRTYILRAAQSRRLDLSEKGVERTYRYHYCSVRDDLTASMIMKMLIMSDSPFKVR